MVKVPSVKASTFQQQLRAAMNDQSVSARELGKRLRPDSPENGRRMVQKYLRAVKPQTPRRERRRELAAALGLPADTFEEDETDLATALLERLFPVVDQIAREFHMRETAKLADVKRDVA